MFVLSLFLTLPSPLHADVRSAATHVWTAGCGAVDDAAAGAALARAAACRPNGGTSAVDGVARLAQKVNADVENTAFAELGAREATELGCAADFASKVAGGDQTALGDLVGKLKALRVARVAWTGAIKELRADRASSGRMCPTTLGELETLDVPSPQMREVCTRVIAAKGAVEMITSAVPLGGDEHVKTLLSEVANGPTEISDDELRQRGRRAFGAAATALKQQGETLRARVTAKAGPNFSANEKRTLLADPRLVQSLVDEDEGALGPVLCRADLNYGAKGDKLISTLTMASLAVGGVATVGLKAASFAGNFARAALVARTAGQISVGTARIFQAAAFAATTGSAMREIQRVCSPRQMSLKTRGSPRACVSAPTVEQLAEDNCALGAALSSFHLATSLPAGTWAAFAPLVRALPGVKAFAAGATEAKVGGAVASEAKVAGAFAGEAKAVPEPRSFLKAEARGRQPSIGRSVPDPEGETAASRMITITGQSKEMGRLEYSVDAATHRMNIEYIRVADDAKDQGVSKALFAQALREHPEVTEIRSVMAVDNVKTVRAHLASKPDDCPGALLGTATAKMGVSLGFTKVIQTLCRSGETREGAFILIQGR